ncbi:cupin domain-containing protein [Bordetella genomosp. 13]|uniref:Cupin n=1 Tax=Bordetella genomosp. 13 TaxID=463040 RepID=A0A1W6ZDF0_9BORD|nr:cupin domain-containing protein [Bordetella genomosp. 13]ARP95170.1 cupin [Bordetella genomosp. 13]
MSITVLSQTAQITDLQDEGPVAAPVSQPAVTTVGREVHVEGMGENRSGVWECQPGTFKRHLANAELMHILAGKCTFTPEGGEPVEFGAGDTVYFPANTRGVWNVETALRKVYAIFG